MKISSILKISLGVALSAACLIGVVGCAQEEAEPEIESVDVDEGLTGGVAATVNGEEIEEDKVTRYINNFRIRGGYESDEDWKEYLTNNSYTVESLREEVIDTMVEQELILQCGEQRGATTDDEEIQSYVDKMRANYSSDEAWQTALEGAGFDDEQAYRDALEFSIINQKLEEGFENEASPDDAKLLEEASVSMTTYDGAKRSSHILFSADDEQKAQEVLDQLRAGEIEFADAAREYSTDTGSAEKGGDVGWDKLTTFVTEYQDALAQLEVGQISDLVQSEYGYHIIQVTDSFTAPETLESLDQIPEDFLTEIRTNITSTSADEAKDAWIEEMRSTNDVVVNPMPEGLPYWVDLGETESPEEQEAIDQAAEDQLVSDVEQTETEVGTAEAEGAGTDAANAAANTPAEGSSE